MSADDAWNALQKADHDCDLDDFRTVSPLEAATIILNLMLLSGFQGLQQGCARSDL